MDNTNNISPPNDNELNLSIGSKPTRKRKIFVPKVIKKMKEPKKEELKKFLKIIVISDTHEEEDFSLIPECDIFIYCGDFSHYSGWWQRTNEDSEPKFSIPQSVLNFNKSLSLIKAKYKFVICGNHDYLDYVDQKEIQEKILTNCVYLQDSSFSINIKKAFPEKVISSKLNSGCLKLYGSPWSIHGMAFGANGNFEKLKKKWDLIEKDTNILITHIPPFNIMDLAYTPGYRNNQTCSLCNRKHLYYSHWGSESLKLKVKELNCKNCLKLHCYGHVHGKRGIQIENFEKSSKNMSFLNGSRGFGKDFGCAYYYPL